MPVRQSKDIMKTLFIILFSIALAGTIQSTYGQGEPVNKHYEKKKKERKKDAEQAEKEILEHHEDIQSRQTKKMMKETKKKSKRLKKGKTSEPFYKKWFIKH